MATKHRLEVDFEELVMKAIEEALSFFGGCVKDVVLYYCSKKHGVAGQELSEKLRKFTRCLEEIFSYAAYIIELQVVSCLFTKVGLRFVERRGWGLVEYVEEARSFYLGGRG